MPLLLSVGQMMMFKFWVGKWWIVWLRDRGENDFLDETFGKVGVTVPVVALYGICGMRFLCIPVENFSPRLRASISVVENWKSVKFRTISGHLMFLHLLSSRRRESLLDSLWEWVWLKFFIIQCIFWEILFGKLWCLCNLRDSWLASWCTVYVQKYLEASKTLLYIVSS